MFGLFLLIIVFVSCKKDDDNNTKPIIEEQKFVFLVGAKDSLDYYDYEPNLDFFISHNSDGYYINSDTVDLNSDNKLDFAIVREGFADGFVSETINYFEYKLYNLNDFEVVCSDINNADTLNFGDTLSNALNWIKNDTYRLIYSDPYYMDGNWRIWGKEKYLGFRKIGTDTIMGWIRIEFPSEGSAIRIKDCAIQK